jgi:hypothetical protein
MTVDEARAVYLSFDGAVEGEHHGHPDFRVGGKIFGTLWPEKGTAVVRLPLEMAEAAAGEDPGSRRIVSRSGGMAWLQLDLAAVSDVALSALAELAFFVRKG